jgi:hypothetical protein
MRIVIPPGLPRGSYDLTLCNPGALHDSTRESTEMRIDRKITARPTVTNLNLPSVAITLILANELDRAARGRRNRLVVEVEVDRIVVCIVVARRVVCSHTEVQITAVCGAPVDIVLYAGRPWELQRGAVVGHRTTPVYERD